MGFISILGNREKYILNFEPKKRNLDSYKNIADTFDSLSDDNLNYIKNLRDYEEITINGFKILMIHGEQNYSGLDHLDKMFDALIEKYDFDLCLFGHIHLFFDKEYRNKRFINPGSIGQPADYPTYKYCIIEITDKIDVKLQEFDIQDTYDLLKKEYENSDYYKRNKIWESLVLMDIRDGKNYCEPFVKMYNDRINHMGNISVEEANKIYEETYQFYCNNMLNQDKKTSIK